MAGSRGRSARPGLVTFGGTAGVLSRRPARRRALDVGSGEARPRSPAAATLRRRSTAFWGAGSSAGRTQVLPLNRGVRGRHTTSVKCSSRVSCPGGRSCQDPTPLEASVCSPVAVGGLDDDERIPGPRLRSGSAMTSPAWEALVMNVFRAVDNILVALATGGYRIRCRSDPAPGSVIAIADELAAGHRERQRRFAPPSRTLPDRARRCPSGPSSRRSRPRSGPAPT